MAVDIRDTGVSPLNASLLPPLSRQLDPRHTAGPHLARSPTPALPSACCPVASRFLARGQPSQQPGPSTTRPGQLTSSEQSLRPADAVYPSAVGGGEFLEKNQRVKWTMTISNPYLRTNQKSLTETVIPTNPSRDANPVRPRRQCHRDGRRRNSPLPRHPTANRRATNRVRQDTAHRGNRESLSRSRRSPRQKNMSD